MPLQILLNILLAFIWMLLNDRITPLDFFIGYLIGMILLYLFRGLLKVDFYFKKVIALGFLLLIFIRELIITNLQVARLVLSKDMKINPGIIIFPTELKNVWEIATLASIISLTPGTLSMAFSEDGKTIYVHCLHIEDKELAIKKIRNTFEKRILEVSS